MKFDSGEVKSWKYGEAKVQGHFLLVNRYGEFPQIDLEQILKNANNCISEIGKNWIGEIELEEYSTVLEKNNAPGMVLYITPSVAQKDLK